MYSVLHAQVLAGHLISGGLANVLAEIDGVVALRTVRGREGKRALCELKKWADGYAIVYRESRQATRTGCRQSSGASYGLPVAEPNAHAGCVTVSGDGDRQKAGTPISGYFPPNV